ncbi:MAG: gamma-glutamylcyclotransferase [Gammaproteobacteria bacterium]|nr:gamma-glutamylcyclotransferase [Gammaproteobacteria bacterium]
MDSTIYYFAYGSNLHYQRIAARVGGCTIHGRARVRGYQLAFHKVSQDGSGKCNAFRTDEIDHELWGVLYGLSVEQQKILDEIEGVGFGYEAEICSVEVADAVFGGVFYVAQTEYVDHTARPYSWYKDFVLHGARQHRLPEPHVEMIEAIEALQDPDIDRHQANVAILTMSDR